MAVAAAHSGTPGGPAGLTDCYIHLPDGAAPMSRGCAPAVTTVSQGHRLTGQCVADQQVEQRDPGPAERVEHGDGGGFERGAVGVAEGGGDPQVGLAAVFVLVAEDPFAHDLQGWCDHAGAVGAAQDGQVDLAAGDDVFGQYPVIQREGGREGGGQLGWFPDEGDAPAGAGGDGLDHDRGGPARAGRCGGGQQDRRCGGDPAIGSNELGDLLVHSQRACPHAGAHAGDTREVAERGEGAVLPVRAVHDRDDSVAATEYAHGVSQAWQFSAAVMPGAVGADRQLDDLVAGVRQRGGDRRGGGEGNLVLAILPPADDGDPRLHRSPPPVTCRRTRAPMPVTISCSIVPAQAAQSATVGSPEVPGPNTVAISPGCTCWLRRSMTVWSMEITPA